MRKLILIFIALLVLAALPAAARDDEAKITLERTACFGPCPVYRLTIHEDGKVVYEGEQFVEVEGKQEIDLGEGTFERLMQGIEDVGYFDWEDEYTTMTVTDHPYVMTSVTRDGETKQINHYTGDDSAPLELSYLENWIDLTVWSQQWTGQAPFLPSSTSAGMPVITLERTPCFGTCPVYQLTLHEDGTVVFIGLNFVEKMGIHLGKIDAEALTSLTEAIADAGYFEWDDAYMDQSVTDLPYVTVSVLGEEGHKRIEHYLGDHNAPEALAEIEDRIDAAVNVEQWIDGASGAE